MLKEAEKYGKIEGTFARVENLVKNYKGIIALIISVATIVLALLGRGIITVGWEREKELKFNPPPLQRQGAFF